MVRDKLTGYLAASPDEAHNVGVQGELALKVHFIFEQVQRPRVQSCISAAAVSAEPALNLTATFKLMWSTILQCSAQQVVNMRTNATVIKGHVYCAYALTLPLLHYDRILLCTLGPTACWTEETVCLLPDQYRDRACFQDTQV